MPEPRKPAPKSPGKNSKPALSRLMIVLLLGAAAVILANYFVGAAKDIETVSYSQFLKDLDAGNITDLTLGEARLHGKLKTAVNGKDRFSTIPVDDPDLVKRLKEKNIPFKAEPKGTVWDGILVWAFPLFLIYMLWGFASQRMNGGANSGLLGLTKNKAKIFVEKDIKTTFADVAGVDEAKEELREVVSFLQDPKQYTRLGGRAPKGVLLVGPPGTGKTLLARAVAGEAKVPYFSINGSEFVELFVGLGAARVRDLFEQSRKQAPCILFIDEIDALGKSRSAGWASGANDEKEQTLNQLLAEMDGFDSSDGVIILASTNRPEILDPALLRAGRFDRQVIVNIPDQVGRLQVLQVHVKKISMDPTVRLERIASLTPGFSGADLANLANEAALFATRRNATAVSEIDFTRAIERIVAGIEQKRRLMNPDEKRRIAYHEMGHATVALSQHSGEKVHKVSIIPRGMGALGYTLQRPTEDRYLMDRAELRRKISVLLGGRAAERAFFSEVSTGASDDLAKATDLARAMVTQFGMSERLGLATFEERQSQFLQGPMAPKRPFSERTAELIDREIHSLLDEGMRVAVEAIDINRAFIEKGISILLATETLEEDDIVAIWQEHGKAYGSTPVTVPARFDGVAANP